MDFGCSECLCTGDRPSDVVSEPSNPKLGRDGGNPIVRGVRSGLSRECAILVIFGEVEMLELESDTRDGADPTESAIETSEAAGETKGISILPGCEGIMMVFRGCDNGLIGRAYERCSTFSSKS